MLRCIIASQCAEGSRDGGWNDPALCALCLRALFTSRGQGLAIERGLAALASLQREDGVWPAEPLRRMPGDALVTAFIILQLGGNEHFRNAVRFEDAIDWFDSHAAELDGETNKLWHHASLRAGVRTQRARKLAAASLWS
jgi:hypothetical protein